MSPQYSQQLGSYIAIKYTSHCKELREQKMALVTINDNITYILAEMRIFLRLTPSLIRNSNEIVVCFTLTGLI